MEVIIKSSDPVEIAKLLSALVGEQVVVQAQAELLYEEATIPSPEELEPQPETPELEPQPETPELELEPQVSVLELEPKAPETEETQPLTDEEEAAVKAKARSDRAKKAAATRKANKEARDGGAAPKGNGEDKTPSKRAMRGEIEDIIRKLCDLDDNQRTQHNAKLLVKVLTDLGVGKARGIKDEALPGALQQFRDIVPVVVDANG